MNSKDYVLSVRIKGDKEGPQTGDVVLDGSSINEWTEYTEYEKGQVVVWNGQFWQANEDHTGDDTFRVEQWTQIGIPDTLLKPWEPNTQYKESQVVYWDGRIYVSKDNFVSADDFNPDNWTEVGGGHYIFTSKDNTVTITTIGDEIDFSVSEFVSKNMDEIGKKLEDKVDKVPGKGLSSNDFTDDDKKKLQDILEIKAIGKDLELTPDGILNNTFEIPKYDDHLSSTSTNAVQNKVITDYLQKLTDDTGNLDDQIRDILKDLGDFDRDIEDLERVDSDLYSQIQQLEVDLATKVDKEAGKQLSTNDFTDSERDKLAALLLIKSIGKNLTLTDGKLEAIDTVTELLDTTGDSTTKGMTQDAITKELVKKIESDDLADVAFTGSYNDLKDVPINVSEFVNDKGYTTRKEIDSDLATLESKLSGSIYDNEITLKSPDGTTISSFTVNQNQDQEIKMPKATKTVEGFVVVDDALSTTSTNPVENRAIGKLVPNTASAVNQLADKDFVNSSINSLSAFGIAYDSDNDPFPTYDDLLNATEYYYAGEKRIPTRNDYAVVLSDEKHDGAQTRYSYVGTYPTGGWMFQYVVNDEPFTADQWAAINSTITKTLVDKLKGIESDAEVNVQADWLQTDTTADDYIKNKPGNVALDSDYQHTDNNLTDYLLQKLMGIESDAEVNVQADWLESDIEADAYIKNKPQWIVLDSDYVHTDNNFTDSDLTKLLGIEDGAEVNVQADWLESDTTADSYIKNKPTSYVLPIASKTELGGIKIGEGLTIESDGVLNANFSELPIATQTVPGAVKIGQNLKIESDGTLSALDSYKLPPASSTTLGGIKLGEGMNVDSDGTLSIVSANDGKITIQKNGIDFSFFTLNQESDQTIDFIIPDIRVTENDPGTGSTLKENNFVAVAGDEGIEMPIATRAILGGVKVGDGLDIDSDGVLSANNGSEGYILPKATYTTLGGVKIGNRISIDAEGKISADDQSYSLPIATPTDLGGIRVGDNLTIKDGLLSANVPTKVSELENDEDFQNSNDVEDAIKKHLSSIMHYKGSVNTVDDLPIVDNVAGDVYNVIKTDDNYAWTGTAWDKLGATVDLSNFYTKKEVDDKLALIKYPTILMTQSDPGAGSPAVENQFVAVYE